MVNFYELGRAHFEACEGLHSFMELEELYGARPDDAWVYFEGFLDAWGAHDEDILREEKPWLFYDPCSWHGHAKAREIFL